DELVRWLGEQFDADAAAAEAAFSGQADPENGWGAYRPEGQRHTTIVPHVGVIHEAVQADHVVNWNPARVLREIDAKRRMIAEVVPEARKAEAMIDEEWGSGSDTDGDLLRLLALPYADRPGYREEWRP
ncbi:DUF6221 family protein, partial [Streptomyces antimycoticus]|uniref:DUF6221 family protein n=1 Tax=Streptomyces antimycoticus TaxID=68175 RepID=UPI000A3BE329